MQPPQQIRTRHFPSITHLPSVLKTFRSSIGPNRVLHLLFLSHEAEEGMSFTRQVVVMESGNDQPTRPGTRNPREPPALSQYQELSPNSCTLRVQAGRRLRKINKCFEDPLPSAFLFSNVFGNFDPWSWTKFPTHIDYWASRIDELSCQFQHRTQNLHNKS